MRHPIHDILTHWLATEQYAFDDSSREIWPPGCWPDDTVHGSGGFDDNPRSSEASNRDPK